MMNQSELDRIKILVEEFLKKITITGDVRVSQFLGEGSRVAENVEVDITLEEPQFLIGQNGETLSDMGRLLSIMLSRALAKSIYLKLDINDYKKKKTDYIKNLAQSLADEVAFTKEKKALPPMSSYERMVVHSELSQRQDVKTESQGEAQARHVVILPQ